MSEEEQKAAIAAQVVQADPLMLTPEVLAKANAVLAAYLTVEE